MKKIEVEKELEEDIQKLHELFEEDETGKEIRRIMRKIAGRE